MTTYNGEKYLKEQLDSIYAQTHRNIEVIVTDDCSTDRTVEILKEYEKAHKLKYYINEKNLGFTKNFEKAISLCNGEYIALADQDDIWLAEKIEILLNNIQENLLIHSDCSIIDEENQVKNQYWKKEHGNSICIQNLLFNNVVTGCTVLFKKELTSIALPFPNIIAYHDWWLAICAAKFNKICYTPFPLVQYRQHPDQHTGIKSSTNILFQQVINTVERLQGIKVIRVSIAEKQKQNLLALKKHPMCDQKLEPILNDAIDYFDNYLQSPFHLNSFKISLKYHKAIYPYRNYLFLKNIIFDIIG